jgi:hypothetical protein
MEPYLGMNMLGSGSNPFGTFLAPFGSLKKSNGLARDYLIPVAVRGSMQSESPHAQNLINLFPSFRCREVGGFWIVPSNSIS